MNKRSFIRTGHHSREICGSLERMLVQKTRKVGWEEGKKGVWRCRVKAEARGSRKLLP